MTARQDVCPRGCRRGTHGCTPAACSAAWSMLNSSATSVQVARNQIWREHCKKEAACLKLSGNFSLPNPSKSRLLKQLETTCVACFILLHRQHSVPTQHHQISNAQAVLLRVLYSVPVNVLLLGCSECNTRQTKLHDTKNCPAWQQQGIECHNLFVQSWWTQARSSGMLFIDHGGVWAHLYY